MTSPRQLWLRFETYHDVTYFTPESRAATDALGCKGGWMGYFGMRAAPLGAASAAQVTSAFYNFHPAKVARAVPEVWTVAPPSEFLRVRLAGVDAVLRRMLGAATIAGLEEAASLAVEAAAAAPTAGRPLGAANADLPVPAEPHLALWQATTTLRESRGDGHVAALVAADLDPCETLALFSADTGLDPAYLRLARGWSEVEWAEASVRLADRGLLAVDGSVTERGKQLRAEIERATDEAAARPWRALGVERTARLAELMYPVAQKLAQDNDAMRRNPMAIDAAADMRA